MITSDSFLATSVQKGDIFAVRGAIIGVIRANLGHPANETREAVRYAQDHGIEVFEAQNDAERPILEDPAKWDEEYYVSVLVDLQQNFTRERLEHALRVSERVFSAPKPAPVPQPQPQRTTQNPSPAGKPSMQPATSRSSTGTEPKKVRSRPTGAVMIGIIAAALIVALIIILTNR